MPIKLTRHWPSTESYPCKSGLYQSGHLIDRLQTTPQIPENSPPTGIIYVANTVQALNLLKALLLS